jgi:hypothetical protein
MALSNLQANVVSSVRQRKHGSSESLVAPPSSTPTTLRPQGQAFKAPTASVLVIEPSTLRCTQRPLCCTPCPDSLVLLLQMLSDEELKAAMTGWTLADLVRRPRKTLAMTATSLSLVLVAQP